MARPSKPVDLIIMTGGKNLTKKEIKLRKEKEDELKSKCKYNPNNKVKQNAEALKMFNKLKKLYKDIEYVDGLDENIINRYCLLTSEVDAMENLLARMNNDIDKCENSAQMITMYKSISGMESCLNKARDMLLKMEDRMFLNPTSRVKSVPKKPEEKKPSELERKFGI